MPTADEAEHPDSARGWGGPTVEAHGRDAAGGPAGLIVHHDARVEDDERGREHGRAPVVGRPRGLTPGASWG